MVRIYGPQYAQCWAVVRCPACRQEGCVDRDQFEGRVSMLCEECGWHETHDLSGEEPA